MDPEQTPAAQPAPRQRGGINGYIKPILGVVLTLIAAGILGWVKFVTASSMDYRAFEAAQVEQRKAHDAQILRLKEDQAARDRRYTDNLKNIYLRLDSIDKAIQHHDSH